MIKRVLSLFSGCGGMDLGFEGKFSALAASINPSIHPDWFVQGAAGSYWVDLPKTSFNTVFANDIRPDAMRAWTKYFAKYGIDRSVYKLGSIVDIVKMQKSGETIFPKDVDVVIGGFPCQDFSIAGKRKGFSSDKSHDGGVLDINNPTHENRGQLYMWMREVIELTLPKIFIAENVKGLMSLKDVKNIIEHDFCSIGGNGYLVVPARVLHAADYGVPQSRERIIFIGFRKSALTVDALAALSQKSIVAEYDPYPIPTHAYTMPNSNLAPPVSLSQAFVGLVEPEISIDASQQKYSKAKYMGSHCQGQTEVNLDGIGPTIRAEHHGNIEFRRLSKEHGGKNEQELADGLLERRLTIRECARIQSFPDDYEFVIHASENHLGVSASKAYELIGNAVPPLLGYHIARRLEHNWLLYFGGDE